MKFKKEKINKGKLKKLILDGISSEDLNSKYDYSEVTDMAHMFFGCPSLEIVPELNTSEVTDMYEMFYNCRNLEYVPELDTSKVTDMCGMFDGCSNLKNINPYNFMLYDFSNLDNKNIKEKYPESYI